MAENSSKKRKQRQKGSSEVSPSAKLQKEGIDFDIETVESEQDEVFEALSLTANFMEKLDQILTKLSGIDSRLESLESSVRQMDLSMKALKVNVKSLESKVEEVETNLTDLTTSTAMIEDEMKETKIQCSENHRELHEETNNVNTKILYLEAYSRRENLKFFGIQEDSPNEDSKETTEIIYDFFETKLGLHDARQIEFQRIHRLGKKNVGHSAARPIIARFLRFADRDYVLNNAKRLKGTNYKIYEDFPAEILKRRRKQMDKFYAARRENKRAYFSKSEPDKLYINGIFQPFFHEE